jgi:predicted 3-demethylubiquinone-9 3-methyltransferase (glyoxalase superfamily)
MQKQKITTFLWFDNKAEEAAKFYTSVFKNGKIDKINKFPGGPDGPDDTTKLVEFTLFGQEFMALDAGPLFKFNESVSLLVSCDSQAEVDEYWSKLTADGGQESQCGWLKDKYGLSWQIVPKRMMELNSSPDRAKAARSMAAMMTMRKIDLKKIEDAYNGK